MQFNEKERNYQASCFDPSLQKNYFSLRLQKKKKDVYVYVCVYQCFPYIDLFVAACHNH